MKNFMLNSIGTVLSKEDTFFVKLGKEYAPALKELKGFSHAVVLWWFDGCDNPNSRNVLEVDAPYTGAPAKMGTFATRSPKRPNPIAVSVVSIVKVDAENGSIEIGYIDANHNTPVLDIKPYTPSLDRVDLPSVPAWCAHWPKSLEESEDFPWETVFTF